ncbi:MAG: transcriptional repressor [Candidatus Brocadiia bacterium]
MPGIATYKRALRRRGLSVTRLRLAIMDALHRRDAAATAAQLLAELRREHSVHKTTVYRNLAALEEADLLRRVPSDGRPSVYELNCSHTAPVHPHFNCRRCGKVQCLEPVDLSMLWSKLNPDGDLRPERAELTLMGLCADCRGKE